MTVQEQITTLRVMCLCAGIKCSWCRAADTMERMLVEMKVLEIAGEDCANKYAALLRKIEKLECDSEWCGKSPTGTPGKRGYDDGKCQICAIKMKRN